MDSLHHGYKLRQGRCSQPHQHYLITGVTRNRIPWFENTHRARLLSRNFLNLDQQGACMSLCFVVMPDHFHWLLELSDKHSLSQTVGMLKSQTARAIGQSIWQRGFYDHALRREEDILQTARYIVANPLRAGLVKSVKDYPYWYAIWL
ncbi:transposase [Alcanivorax sp.]|jgi:REP element-mobilizing transposase RayT|uniref:REP-associated tyrosine transposase n=1 Tax=Alcanivorax sp. TaxID=1872427 RepID=UPI0019A674F8|nr:transposase [Alcanivorax sp.]MBD3645575.1 transposase [Alcanivorax sp.]